MVADVPGEDDNIDGEMGEARGPSDQFAQRTTSARAT